MRSPENPVTLLSVLAVAIALTPAGCSEDLKAGGWGFGRLFKPEGEPWTIRCLVLTGANRRVDAESIADVLRDTRGIRGRDVRLEHDAEESTIYYGKYYRRIDRKTRRPEITRSMKRDMRALKELGVPGQGHYFADARFVPLPTPDVGDPAFSLDWAKGVYSLRVAVFANEPGFYERKKAAAEYTTMLRKKGHRTFYRHGPIHSEVFVGEFGEDAVRSVEARRVVEDDGNPWGVGQEVIGFNQYSREVRALRARENFAFELWNLRRRGEKIGNRTVYTASRLVRIRDELEDDQW